MKFTVSVSALILALPLLAQASPAGFGFGGGFGKGAGAGAGAGGKGAAAPPAAAGNNKAGGAAAASSVAATAVASVAASGSAAAAAAAAAGTASAAAAASTAAAAATGDIQSSLTLDPSVIAKGFANNGQDVPDAGQVASATSTNNFINFCAGTGLNITNGQQIVGGSCNPAPMGIIAAQSNMPSCKFQNPTNGAVLKANTPFTITMAVSNLETGNFVNPNENYFSAPQTVNSAGNIVGHSHVTVDFLDSTTQTTPTNPQKFAFFKGLNDVASNGLLTADVTEGLPAGSYRLASINSAANHQPVLVAVAQHGALDDMVYFTVTADGTADAAAGSAASASAAAATASAAASAAPAASSAAAGAAGAAASAAPSAAPAAAAANKATAGLKGGKPAVGKGGKRTVQFARDNGRFEVRRNVKSRALF
jgi:hypothetical protein